jgi:hypothetical protein
MQLQLTFGMPGRGKIRKGCVKEVSAKLLPLLALPDAHAPELIAALGDPEESTTSRRYHALNAIVRSDSP